jgi:hypothetical protein
MSEETTLVSVVILVLFLLISLLGRRLMKLINMEKLPAKLMQEGAKDRGDQSSVYREMMPVSLAEAKSVIEEAQR